MEKDNVAYPSRIGADISIDEEQVLMVAMSIKEIERYQNMKSFQKAILKVIREKTSKQKSVADSQISKDSHPTIKQVETGSTIKQVNTHSGIERKRFYINKKVILIAGAVVFAVAAIALAIVFLPNLLQANSTETASSGVVDEDKVIVPNVKSMTEEEALATLESARLKGVVKYEYSSSVVEGSVIRQSVPADNMMNPQTTVTIFISLGTEQDEDGVSVTAEATPEPTQETTPESTAEPVQTEWSAWSKWMDSDVMRELIATKYSDKIIDIQQKGWDAAMFRWKDK